MLSLIVSKFLMLTTGGGGFTGGAELAGDFCVPARLSAAAAAACEGLSFAGSVAPQATVPSPLFEKPELGTLAGAGFGGAKLARLEVGGPEIELDGPDVVKFDGPLLAGLMPGGRPELDGIDGTGLDAGRATVIGAVDAVYKINKKLSYHMNEWEIEAVSLKLLYPA